MQDELGEALSGLRQIHQRMIQRLMLNQDYRAMVTIEASIASISGIISASPGAAIEPLDIPKEIDRELEAIDEETPASPLPHATPRLATSPFVPRQHAAFSQSAALIRQAGN
jgi:hypothetical protein